mmetsp:Transcript_30147/g.45425  ORF Transcript_30147/g.45425 Transcript_30147/m.45425 type:complete len:135 (+) Transcript_30147:101-505(+)
MLPYILVWPLWFGIAVLLPLMQSLHAIQEKSGDQKTWLCYWMLFVVTTWIMYYFEWVVAIPFYILSFYVDIYYEAQIFFIFWLVFPKTLGILKVQEELGGNAATYLSKAKHIAKAQLEKATVIAKKALEGAKKK